MRFLPSNNRMLAVLANSLKVRALIVNANLSEYGRNLELLLDSEVNIRIGSLITISGVHLNVINTCFSFVMVTVRNEDVLNSNLSNVGSFDNLMVEISLTNYLPNRFNCFSLAIKTCCTTLIEITESKFECLLTFDRPALQLSDLKVGNVVTIDGLILMIQFVCETTFDVIFHKDDLNIKDYKL